MMGIVKGIGMGVIMEVNPGPCSRVGDIDT